MGFVLTLVCLLTACNCKTSISNIVMIQWDLTHEHICTSATVQLAQPPVHLDQNMSLSSNRPRDLIKLPCLLALCNHFMVHERSCLVSTCQMPVSSCNDTRPQLLIVLLLLLSGHIQPNPGPELQDVQTPSDFKSLTHLKFIHLNVRSLLSKMDMVRIWTKSTDADIIVISKTWLTKSITDEDINIKGYNVYRTDRPKKGGGVAIYVKTKFDASVILSESICKQLEFLALNVEIYKGLCVTVVGCYRPPSASKEALDSLKHLLSKLSYSELVLAGDLNWDWLQKASAEFKSFCDSINLTQLVHLPTQLNCKDPERSTLIDLILTNVPHKFSSLGVLCNDLSDHCAVAAIRSTKVQKSRPHIIFKRNLKHFNEQAYFHDLSNADWMKIKLIPDVEIAWVFFRDTFMQIVNRHAPFKKYRVKGHENPWFSSDLADRIHERNLAWAKARTTGSMADWTVFRRLRNKCSTLIKNAKSEYYLSLTTDNLNNPQKFWEVIKSLTVNKSAQTLPTYVLKDSVTVYDRRF